jgi:hypothetical protein
VRQTTSGRCIEADLETQREPTLNSVRLPRNVSGLGVILRE